MKNGGSIKNYEEPNAGKIFETCFAFAPSRVLVAGVDLGQGLYDIVILGQICHSEGAENSRKLLSRAYCSLKHGCKLLIADMIPDDERCSAIFPLLFAVNMLIHTSEGNTFTKSEYNEWLQDAGFSEITTLDVPGPSPLIAATGSL